MYEQQNDSLKNKEDKNQYLVDQTQNLNNLTENDISVPNRNKPTTNKPSTPIDNTYIQRIQQLQKQNALLHKKNKQVVSQLQQFSRKLDEQIRKRSFTTQKKQNRLIKPQQKQSIEIQNLYKKIEIYKKEISLLKGKISDQNEGKLNDYQNRLKVQIKENEQLREQIKSMKKIIKQQEKGLSLTGSEGYLKIMTENQSIKEELKRMRIQMDQVQRKYRTNSTHLSANTPKNGGRTSSFYQRNRNHYERSQLPNDKLQSKIQKTKGKRIMYQNRLKTEPDLKDLKLKGKQQNQSQLNLNEIKPQQKIQKYQTKFRLMVAQKQRQRQIIENLKIQIIQKDKQINYFKQKLQSFRKLSRAKRYKMKYQSSSMIEQKQNENESIDANNQVNEKYLLPRNLQAMEEYLQGGGSQKKKHSRNQNYLKEIAAQYPVQTNYKTSKYPRSQQKGGLRQSTYRWNHYQFSSKIKQVQVFSHVKGHIQDIHVRYEKGEPNKILQSKKYTALVCEQTQEFIQQIRGGFKYGYLQYIVFKTNTKRVAEFCNVDIQNECDNFVFNISNEEYPCSFFGENDNEGIVRFGCFIQKLQNK